MGIRATLAKPLANLIWKKHQSWMKNPSDVQQKWMELLLKKAKSTKFGKDHGFENIQTYNDFKNQVPVRDYEQLSGYISSIQRGEHDVLWPGKPAYFAKTSGTTSGTKYIPISKESMPFHINAARDALLSYVNFTGKSNFLDGKLIFLSGSPELERINGILTGRLSGIVNHHVPGYLRSNQMPDYATNCIEDWEEKLDKIVNQTLKANMTLISGIPPWVQMYFDKIIERTGKSIGEVFPNFEMFVYGGVNFEPYRQRFMDAVGKYIPSIETYPASEGFLAFQNDPSDPSLLLLANSGIFFEFIPADQYFEPFPPRLSIDEVKTGINYAVILNTSAGLWGYSIGDMVKFTQLNPHKLVVTGRVKHFISAFGEHVIGEEVEKAMKMTCEKFPEVVVTEFTVAPNVNPSHGLSHHQWCVEFANLPNHMESFSTQLDHHLTQLNTYYLDLIKGNILAPLKVIPLSKNTFIEYMKGQGKLGGQNKVPRLSNDRKLAEALLLIHQQLKQN